MRDLRGKAAFVTGAASGIEFALARVFAVADMRVMLADIETDALALAVEKLQGLGPGVRGVICDVADPASVERAAEASFEAFGNVHVVCNNAGVAGGSGIEDISVETWRWVLDVPLPWRHCTTGCRVGFPAHSFSLDHWWEVPWLQRRVTQTDHRNRT
jgi:NAD(P)-dependent dehydrogenase (short-subunit alcohol dehydrogenase family)